MTTLRTETADGLIDSIQELKKFADRYILQPVAKEAEPTYLHRAIACNPPPPAPPFPMLLANHLKYVQNLDE